MFDILGIIDFEGRNRDIKSPFEDLEPYSQVQYAETKCSSKISDFICLSTDNFKNISLTDNIQVFIYGYCFTKISCSENKAARRLNADDIVALYKKSGVSFYDKIKGSFSIIIIDIELDKIFILTDPLNLRTLYYSRSDDRLIISSSLNALIYFFKHNKENIKLNFSAFLQYYLFDYVLNNETYIENVNEIPPGSLIVYDRNNFEIKKYWDVFEQFPLSAPEYNEQESIELLDDIIKKNLALYSQGPQKTAVALTGGLDSRTLAAMLGSRINEYTFFSYGRPLSWDLKIPQLIAHNFALDYQPIELAKEFDDTFETSATMAVYLGDGITELTRANYAYVYSKYLMDKSSILTGLFGSELIKHPSSRGLFLDKNIISILNSENQEKTTNDLINLLVEKAIISKDIIQKHRSEIMSSVLGNNFINNQLPIAKKYFYYLLMVGIRKYFLKEIKVERPFVQNFHPFFDIEFIEILLKSPFPWIYNWSDKKSLTKNIRIHRFYSDLIGKNNPQLLKIMTTHGYKPKHLSRKMYLPFLIFDYYRSKKEIKVNSSYHMDRLIFRYADEQIKNFSKYETIFNNKKLFKSKAEDFKNFTKIISFQTWLHLNCLERDVL